MDLTPFTDFVTDVLAAVSTAGGAVIGIFVAAITFGFILAWINRGRKAGQGRAGS